MPRKRPRSVTVRRLRLGGERLENRALLAVSPALLNSWFVAGQGQFAQVYVGQPGGTVVGPSTTWSTQSSPVIGDVQKVSFSTTTDSVYVNTPDLASYVMGAWWGNTAQTQPFINLPKDQNATFRITLNSTYPSTTHSIAGNGPIGIAVNGVVFYNAGDAFTYAHASATEANPGDGLFNRLAEAVEAVTFDVGNGHQPGNGQYHYHENPVALRAQLDDNVDYVGTTNYFPYDPAVYYLTHGEGADGDFRERTAGLHHSPIIGWMFDGYPVYGPYGYSDPNDPASAVVRMQSSFALRSITTRTTLPGWAAQMAGGKLGPGAAGTAADGVYTMTTTQQGQYAGPAVSATYPLGRYGEDFAYVPGSGHLDQFNGRWCRTPEFPNGTYAYFATVDAAGAPAFPYLVHRQYYGQTNGSGKVTSITEPVTVSFNVATNTAPVVSGPGSFTVAQSATRALAGSLRVGVADVDEATVESVALAVTAGTLNLDLAGPLAGRVTIVSGGNHAAAVTISGALDELNAALATLTYTAPASGLSATLTVQANDGSAANNLSATLATSITLDNVPPTAAIAAVASPRTAALASVAITFSEAVTGFDKADLVLTRDGTPVPLTAATLTGSGASWSVGGLADLTAMNGAYVLTVVAAGSGIVDVDGGGLAANASASWTMDASVTVPAGQTETNSTGYSGAFQLVKRGAGRLVLAAAGSNTGGTVVEAGELVVRDVAALGSGSVRIAAGARLTLDLGPGGVSIPALVLDAAGLIDLGFGRLAIAAGGVAESELRARVIAGRADGSWRGTAGITSSAAATTASRAVGCVVDDSGGAIVAFAATADANVDGIVDVLDAAAITAGGGFNTGLSAEWSTGDFNYDGIVDVLDVADFMGTGLFNEGSYLPAASGAAVLSATDLAFAELMVLDATTVRTKTLRFAR